MCWIFTVTRPTGQGAKRAALTWQRLRLAKAAPSVSEHRREDESFLPLARKKATEEILKNAFRVETKQRPEVGLRSRVLTEATGGSTNGSFFCGNTDLANFNPPFCFFLFALGLLLLCAEHSGSAVTLTAWRTRTRPERERWGRLATHH